MSMTGNSRTRNSCQGLKIREHEIHATSIISIYFATNFEISSFMQVSLTDMKNETTLNGNNSNSNPKKK